jgi:DNA-binding NarL/FixJ family response regulator
MNSIVVADAHLFICKGIATLIQEMGPYKVVAEASEGREAVRATLDHQPDLLVVSADISGLDCLEALAIIKRRRSMQRVLLLCETDACQVVREAIRLGCEGFLRKNTSQEDLSRAVAEVLGGRTYADPEISRRLLLAGDGTSDDRVDQALRNLSQRERAVFRLIAQGHTNRTAAENMHLSHKTVEKHRAATMRKLNLRSAVDLRMLAVELGVVQRGSGTVA